MSYQNVFIYYDYANVIKGTLDSIILFNSEKEVTPSVVSEIQLKTVRLEDSDIFVLVIIKEVLTLIGSALALFASSNTYDPFQLFSLIFLLNILLFLLSLLYLDLSTQSGFNFSPSDINFILVGEYISTIQTNSLVESSNLNTPKDPSDLFNSVLSYGRLREVVQYEDVLNIYSKLSLSS
jgi:hypothetical protein